MREFRKAKKNRIGKIYKKNIENIIFNEVEIDTDTNSIVTEETEEIKKARENLENYCLEHFDDNLNVYKKNKYMRNLKFFLTFDVPAIATALSCAFVLHLPKKTEIVPAYKLECTMLSDDKIVQDTEDGYYFSASFDPEIDESLYTKKSDLNTRIQYQVKNGTKNTIINLKTNDEGKLSYSDALQGNFYDRNADVFKGIEPSEIEAKYQEIVNDIADFIMNESTINNSMKKEITQMLEEEKTTVITTVLEYIKVMDISLTESQDAYEERLALWGGGLGALIVIYFIIALAVGGNKNKILSNNLSSLIEYSDTAAIVPFKTARKCQEAFVMADKGRIACIKEIAEKYLTPESQEILLSSLNKSLIKKK